MIRDASLGAYNSTVELREAQLQRVLAALQVRGVATADDLCEDIIELDIYQVRRRITDLQKKGFVRDTGRRALNDGGKYVIVWGLVPKEPQGRLF